MSVSKDWFVADRSGLKKQAKEIGVARTVMELYSNCVDERVGTVDIKIAPIGRNLAQLSIEDDSPDGFRDIADAFTMFKESYKRLNPKQRGRFNIGEKNFLALCKTATVSSTSGEVVFDDEGRHEYPKRKRLVGTLITAQVEMTKQDIADFDHLMNRVFIPEGVIVKYNGIILHSRKPVKEIEVALPTLRLNDEGVLKATIQKTEVQIFNCSESETPYLYEMGVPVVETDIRWEINVNQKIPLNRDRDNVAPSYKKEVCRVVAEAMQTELTKDDANSWANEVLADDKASDAVLTKLLDEKFGKDRVIFNPKDPEANTKAVLQGHSLIYSRSLSKAAREVLDSREAVRATMPTSSTKFPTPKPYSDDPNADPAEIIPESEYTPGMVNVAEYVKFLAKELLKISDLRVSFVRDFNAAACYKKYGPHSGMIDFNVNSLGRKWFDNITERVDRLIIHELSHHSASNHYSDEYFDACCELGAKLKRLAMDRPEDLRKFDEKSS